MPHLNNSDDQFIVNIRWAVMQDIWSNVMSLLLRQEPEAQIYFFEAV